MGFLKSLEKMTQATIKVVLTPLDIAKDTVEVMEGELPTHTICRLRAVKDKLEEAYDELDSD